MLSTKQREKEGKTERIDRQQRILERYGVEEKVYQESKEKETDDKEKR